ncbi:MAG: amino acid adenylation domain-containing protein, partial [Symploca sp. SIO1C4]|nr:amino acid adenylation domain-containing protein [Symploca sp. SIO1C4]
LLNVTVLEQSLREIVRRHSILRTTFTSVDGQPVQVISPETDLRLPIINLQALPKTERELQVQRLATQEAQQPFDLATGPLMRIKLLRLEAQEHVLVLIMHHIVSDGWSLEVFFKELTLLYQAFSQSKPSPLPELSIQYADFAHWQQQLLQDTVLDSQLSYWKHQLRGNLPILQLPTDKKRSPVYTYRGASQYLVFSSELSNALKKLTQQESVTLFMTLLTAFKVLLYRYSGEEDLIVGSPIAGRNQMETEGLIGFFVNTLVMRTDLSGNPSFRKLLSRVREVALGAYTHQELPFDKLVEELQPERDLSHPPLFQVMFVLQNDPKSVLELPDLTINHLNLDNQTTKFDLTLSIKDTKPELRGRLEYNTDLFNSATIERMLGHFQTLLEAIVTNPEQQISQLSLLTDKEHHQLIVEWNHTQTEYPQEPCIHQLFEAQVQRTPEAVAVVFEGQQLTYQQLNCLANQLAHHLQKLGVKPEVMVGICVERSLEMLVGMFGILKAGGAYVPLDPTYPQERLAWMLSDSKVPILLTQEHLLAGLGQQEAQILCLDKDWALISSESDHNLVTRVQPENLAYVIYTSGSTGKPKGVLVPHQGLCNLAQAQSRSFGVNSDSNVLQFASFSFDASISEVVMTICCGARLSLASKNSLLPGAELMQLLRKQRITHVTLSPSVLAVLPTKDLPDLQSLIVAGEACSPNLIEQWSKGRRFFNAYGPTEATVCATIAQCTDGSRQPPIGRPIANTQVYILDRHLQPTPVGVPGELHIGGVGIARGYLNRPHLTQDKFISNPFSSQIGSRLYKTGDWARYLPDGNIEFLGRIDNQVKIRGFRIELGEIEAALAAHPQVQESVVIAREEQPGDKRLVAYLVPKQEQVPATSKLRDSLKKNLPDYMIPSAFVLLDSLPLTPNGKVYYRSLPLPKSIRQKSAEKFVAPQDEFELHLKNIWEKVLGLESISVNANFFDLGGHSLLAVTLFAEIEQKFNRKLPMATLFEAPTIEQLAGILRQSGHSKIWDSLVPIKSSGSKEPLFLIHDADGETLLYLNLAHSLDSERPVYGLGPHGKEEYPILHTRIVDMAAHYIEKICKIQPQGPYLLGGLCLGGVLAFEIALQLQAQGQKVALVALFDSANAQTSKKRGRITNQRLSRFSQAWSQSQQLKGREQLLHLLKTVTKKVTNTLVYESSTKIVSLKNKFKLRLYRYYLDNRLPLPKLLQNISVRTICGFASKEYIPKVFQGRLTLFRATETLEIDNPLIDDTPTIRKTNDPLFGWAKWAKYGVEVYDLPGGHSSMLQEPHVQVLAEHLQACLKKTLADAQE